MVVKKAVSATSNNAVRGHRENFFFGTLLTIQTLHGLNLTTIIEIIYCDDIN